MPVRAHGGAAAGLSPAQAMKLQLAIVIAVLAACQALPRRLQQKGPKSDVSLQIVGGLEADIEDFPYQISMMRYGSHRCGGSILSETWILTAAHCADGVTADMITVRAGSTMHSSGGQVAALAWLGMHPQFNSDTMVHDVALLQLATPLTLDGLTTRAATLVAPNTPFQTSSLVTVSGWGTLHSGDHSLPEHLMAVMVPALPLEVCKQVYDSQAMYVDGTMVCAGVGGKDSCQGDSGGPLVDENQVQVGVVSWGIGCGFAGYPGLYANLAHPEIHKWIADTAKF